MASHAIALEWFARMEEQHSHASIWQVADIGKQLQEVAFQVGPQKM